MKGNIAQIDDCSNLQDKNKAHVHDLAFSIKNFKPRKSSARRFQWLHVYLNRYDVEFVVEPFIRRNHYFLPGISSKFSSCTMGFTDEHIMLFPNRKSSRQIPLLNIVGLHIWNMYSNHAEI